MGALGAMSRSERLSKLRARAGKSREEMATLAGVSLEGWDDLERYDEEIEECISIDQLVAIAKAFDVEPWDLLANDGEQLPPTDVSFDQVANIVRDRMGKLGFSLHDLEHQVGWALGPFLEAPDSATKNPASFLRDLCTDFGIAWGRVSL
jgi:transcriptional regulator with XRE-family HTH domain